MSKIGNEIAELFQVYQQEEAKFEAGNKAAGTRARKALMGIKKLCDVRRKEIQSEKNAA